MITQLIALLLLTAWACLAFVVEYGYRVSTTKIPYTAQTLSYMSRTVDLIPHKYFYNGVVSGFAFCNIIVGCLLLLDKNVAGVLVPVILQVVGLCAVTLSRVEHLR